MNLWKGKPRAQNLSLGAACIVIVILVFPVQALATPADSIGHWAEQILLESMAQGIIQGYPDGTTKPEAPISRAEMAALACRVLGEEENQDSASRLLPVYADVPSSHWAAGYVRLCQEAGIVTGDGDGRFRPSDAITRSEIAVILARAARRFGFVAPAQGVLRFSDSQAIPGWAVSDIQFAVGLGLLLGDSDGRIRPLDQCSRAEVATVLIRLLDLQGRRWDVVGTVKSTDFERGSLKIGIVGGEAEVNVDSNTAVYRGENRQSLPAIKPGDRVRLLLGRILPVKALVISLD